MLSGGGGILLKVTYLSMLLELHPTKQHLYEAYLFFFFLTNAYFISALIGSFLSCCLIRMPFLL